MIDDHLRAAAVAVLNLCRERKLMVVTAESCTGGLVAGCLTEVPGSSDVVERGFVTYSNDAKQEMLGVSADILREHGAVSRAAAEAMAQGAIARSRAHLAVSVTGVAGPGGGTPAKPVGLVHFAGATRDRPADPSGAALWRYRPLGNPAAGCAGSARPAADAGGVGVSAPPLRPPCPGRRRHRHGARTPRKTAERRPRIPTPSGSRACGS